MKKLAARDFEDLLQVTLEVLRWFLIITICSAQSRFSRAFWRRLTTTLSSTCSLFLLHGMRMPSSASTQKRRSAFSTPRQQSSERLCGILQRKLVLLSKQRNFRVRKPHADDVKLRFPGRAGIKRQQEPQARGEGRGRLT
jgi:hypothetical protein